MVTKNIGFISFSFLLFLTCSKQEIYIERNSKSNSILEFDSTLKLKNVYVPDTTNIDYVPKRILTIKGDFDGDGQEEVLRERYFNPKTGKDILSVPQGGDMDWLASIHVQCNLISDVDSISDLVISDDWTWGLLSLLNLGDTNLDGLDEVAVVRDNPDYSNVTSCWIYQYCCGVWKVVFSFGLHEETYWYPDDFDTSIYYKEIPGFLEYQNGEWYFYDHWKGVTEAYYSDKEGNPLLHRLRIRKRCKC